MELRRLLVLANSIKKGGRCVAGRVLEPGPGPGRALEWFRPVSEVGEGELLMADMRVAGKAKLLPFDVVHVPVSKHAGNAGHPEDWIVTGGLWQYERTADVARVGALLEHPQDLWLEPNCKSDRVTPSFARSLPKLQSLYLIRPDNLRIVLGQELSWDRSKTKWVRRARFGYQGVQYDFGMTDPEFTDQLPVKAPEVGHPFVEFPASFGDRSVLCVSLTPPFNGWHYKVVATVLALP